jgi:DNA (cytosine-5)-methyltransferase 1
MSKKRLTAVSLFSGCGGFCEGIESAGFQVLSAVEKDRFACETYRFNFLETPLFEGDIRGFLHSDQEGTRQFLKAGDVDLVFGGPPCQGYSQIGTRLLDDERNFLFNEFIRVLTVLRPSVFLMENVPNILLLNKGHFKNLILAAFREAGYANTTYVRLLASHFGVPQDRKRVFFVGFRDGYEISCDLQQFILARIEEQAIKSPVTVWQAIGDLPADVVPSGETMDYPANSFSPYQEMMRLDCTHPPYTNKSKMKRGIRHFEEIRLHNHHTKEIQERRLALINMLEPGKKADSLPKSVWNGLRPEKWRRLHPDLPAYTLLANMHRDLSEFVHPRLNRWITVREAARLQSFHDGFVFVGSEWQQLKQIGNAVPPLLGRAIGKAAAALHEFITTNGETRRVAKQLTQTVLPFDMGV